MSCRPQGITSAPQVPSPEQLVVVRSANDTSTQAVLQRYEMNGKTWKPKGKEIAVTVGRSGLAWGRGLHDAQPGQQKREGDGKSPSGVFRFGKIFGYAPASEVSFKMPYVQANEALECVDDPQSRYYNSLVDNKLVQKDWNSSEFMRRTDHQYKWGATVEHNTSPMQPAGGSCIFFHIWKVPGAPTSGCTAMTEQDLLTLLHWLDAGKSPILLQVTEAEYPAYRQQFGLPE
jgi:L,D-peptidoglycan transpeptidase YkuD (ErfK/YbiS/YcfS/YnhG family)